MTLKLKVKMALFDCTDTIKLARWWAEHFGGEINEWAPGEFVVVSPANAPRLGFHRVNNPTPGTTRLHLDFVTPDFDTEVKRLTAAGATAVGQHSFADEVRRLVLTDRDGNAFCVADGQPAT